MHSRELWQNFVPRSEKNAGASSFYRRLRFAEPAAESEAGLSLESEARNPSLERKVSHALRHFFVSDAKLMSNFSDFGNS